MLCIGQFIKLVFTKNEVYEMLKENYFDKFDEDDRLISYHPIKPIEIFNYRVEQSDCIINISKELTWVEVAPILTNYLEWLTICESKLIDYFRLKLKENLPHDWFKNIEVYSVDITFLASCLRGEIPFYFQQLSMMG